MSVKPICYVPSRVLPEIYSGVPSFAGVPVIAAPAEIDAYDVVVAGMPWEGICTTGGWTGVELGPKAIRSASVRYGGFLPDRGYDLFDRIRVGDYGDCASVPGDAEATFAHIEEKALQVFRRGKTWIGLGGDHSVLVPELRALARSRKKIGLVHLDSHLDNLDTYGEAEKYARCSPLFRAYEMDAIGGEHVVHIGIRGPRNHPDQLRLARERGATVFSSFQVREMGVEETFRRAVEIAGKGTEGIYVTVCSDVLDAAFNPGGPADFAGLGSHELLSLLYRFGRHGVLGFDFVEIYPPQDANNTSGHMAAWAVLYLLSGVAGKDMSSAD